MTRASCIVPVSHGAPGFPRGDGVLRGRGSRAGAGGAEGGWAMGRSAGVGLPEPAVVLALVSLNGIFTLSEEGASR